MALVPENEQRFAKVSLQDFTAAPSPSLSSANASPAKNISVSTRSTCLCAKRGAPDWNYQPKHKRRWTSLACQTRLCIWKITGIAWPQVETSIKNNYGLTMTKACIFRSTKCER